MVSSRFLAVYSELYVENGPALGRMERNCLINLLNFAEVALEAVSTQADNPASIEAGPPARG